MKPTSDCIKPTDTQAAESTTTTTPLEPRVIADLLEEVLEERGSDDRRQGVLPDSTPEVDRRSSVPRRTTDKIA